MSEWITIGVSVLLSGSISFGLAWYKTSTEMKKQIASYKLEQINYYNRIKYDTEFQAYKDVSGKIYSMVKIINSLKVPTTPINDLSDDERQRCSDEIRTAQNVLDDLNMELYRNLPFIKETVSDEIEKLIRVYGLNFSQLLMYYCDYVDQDNRPLERRQPVPLKDIHEQWWKILRIIRQTLISYQDE